jgi:hypothetical protein
VKQHKSELKQLPTWALNIDSIYKFKDLKCFTSELNGFRKCSANLAHQISEIAQQIGCDLPTVPMTFAGGATDTSEFARVGIEGTCIIALPVEFMRDGMFYHTSQDTVDKIEPEAVNAIIKIVGTFILEKDQL